MNREKSLETLVESYLSSANRARRVFLVSNITTVLLLVTYYNLHWTWLRHLADPQGVEATRPAGYLQFYTLNADSTVNLVDVRGDMVGQLGRDFLFADFALVGAKIFAHDIPILGGVALSIIMTWYFYARRRERGVMKEIASVVEGEENPETVRYVFYGISFNLIFNTVPGIDAGRSGPSRRFANTILKSLFYAPCVIMTLIIGHDVFETFYKNMHTQEYPLYRYLLVDVRGGKQLFEVGVRLFISAMLLAYSWVQAWHVSGLSAEDGHFRRQIEQQHFANESAASVDDSV